jgi:hypothetical protein
VEGGNMTNGEARKLYEEYTKLENDKERLQFFIAHRDVLEITLDNDNSTGFFKDLDDDSGLNLLEFDCYFGNAKGVYLLFEQLGIEAQPC